MHTSPRLLLDSLKRCPLCEAMNAEASGACFVCGWSGAFDRDVKDLQASFDDIVAKCPAFGIKPKRKGARDWTSKFRRIFHPG